MLHLEAIDPHALELLKRLQRLPALADTRLVCGTALALRSMSYFVDAEAMPMPQMLIDFDWDAAVEKIRASVRNLVLHG